MEYDRWIEKDGEGWEETGREEGGWKEKDGECGKMVYERILKAEMWEETGTDKDR